MFPMQNPVRYSQGIQRYDLLALIPSVRVVRQFRPLRSPRSVGLFFSQRLSGTVRLAVAGCREVKAMGLI